jgi:hypothetical protein
MERLPVLVNESFREKKGFCLGQLCGGDLPFESALAVCECGLFAPAAEHFDKPKLHSLWHHYDFGIVFKFRVETEP